MAYNDPYKGVALIGRIGQPEYQRHSLQIEINRRIYLDEDTREPSANFAQVQQHLQEVMLVVAQHVREQMQYLPVADHQTDGHEKDLSSRRGLCFYSGLCLSNNHFRWF